MKVIDKLPWIKIQDRKIFRTKCRGRFLPGKVVPGKHKEN